MKSVLRAVAIGAVLLLSSETALAVNLRGPIACDLWTQDREKQKQAQGAELTWVETSIVQNWLLGYLSGLAVATNREFWGQIPNANSLDNESVFSWIDNYCRTKPSENLRDAGNALFREKTEKK